MKPTRSMQAALIDDGGGPVLLVPQAASTSGAVVLVVSLVEPASSGFELRIEGGHLAGADGDADGHVAVHRFDALDGWRPWPAQHLEPMLWWRRIGVVPPPGGQARVTVHESGDGRIIASATTIRLDDDLPSDGLRMRVSSCFDQGRFGDRTASAIVTRPSGSSPPVLNLMLGDQVYLDAPVSAIGRSDRDDPEAHNVRKYVKSFGAAGLGRLLAEGPTWFLPDDHEIWNDFPHPTALLPQSMHEELELPWITSDALHQFQPTRRARFWLRVAMTVAAVRGVLPQNRGPRSKPLAGSAPPGDVTRRWLDSALDLFSIFQTPDEDPPSERGTGTWTPTTVRHAELAAGVDAVFVDTRRTRQYKTAGDSLLLTEADRERLTTLIETAGTATPAGTPGLLVLAFAEPLIGHRRTRSLTNVLQWMKKLVTGPTDHSITQYTDYDALVAAVARRADAGRPTLLLGGDVHHSLVAIGREDRVVEVTSSPLALVRMVRPAKKAVEPTADGYRFLGAARRTHGQFAEVRLKRSADDGVIVAVHDVDVLPREARTRKVQQLRFRLSPSGVFEPLPAPAP